MKKPNDCPANPNPGETQEAAAEFIFHSTEKKKGHHSVLPKIAIPPELDQLMTEIMARTHFPYRSKADIVRDALFHRLAWLCDHMEDGHGDMLNRVKIINAAIAAEQTRVDYEEVIQGLKPVLLSLSDSLEQQKILVGTVMEQIRNMPAGYWREKYLDQMKSQYGHLIEGWSAGKRSK